MSILNKILGMGSKVMPNQSQSEAPGYFKHAGIDDGDAAYDTEAEVIAVAKTLTTGVYGLLWEKTVSPQQEWSWGYGNGVLSDNQGYLWFCLVDKTTEFMKGNLRLCQGDANGFKKFVIQDFADSQLHSQTNTTVETATLTDRKSMIALPEAVAYPKVGQDSKLFLEYKHIAGTLANIDGAGFRIPVTIRPL
jgi:hypothetical protein